MKRLVLLIVVASITHAQKEIQMTPMVLSNEVVTVYEVPPIEYEVLQDLLAEWTQVSMEIPHTQTAGRFALTLVSRETGIITLVPDNPDMVMSVRAQNPMTVYGGEIMGVNFTAFEPHSGIIEIYNEVGTLIASAPYEVTRQSEVRQRVNMNYNFNNIVSASYSVSHVSNGLGAGVNIRYDFSGENLTGTINGSYSW